MCFFFHKYKAKSVCKGIAKHVDYGAEVGITQVLMKCERCGNTYTRRLIGYWTLEEVRD